MQVEAAALGAFASRIHGLGLDVAAGRRYIRDYADFSWQEEGLIGLLRSAHDKASGEVEDAMRHLELLLDKSAFELRFAEGYYVKTDAVSAAELDQTFEGAPQLYGPLRPGPPAPYSPLNAWHDPRSNLDDPGEPEARIGDGYVDPVQVFELVSPASWLNWLLKETLGFDAIGSMTRPFLGDWRALARYGIALENLGECLGSVAHNIRFARDDIARHWSGNAASSALAYFTEVSVACVAAQGALRELAGQYKEAARGNWLFANQVAGVITGITDAAMVGGVGAGIGTFLGWTGIGAWAGGTLAASQVVRIWGLIDEATGIIRNAGSALTAIAGAVLGMTDLGGLKSLSLPEHPYDHPGVP
ncbi:hypothetical protein [Phytohabitans kaempferiae]|uniref:WXG100 family type VII secretion target n=1 Tax=Phytohabitans kaempferiae TaxID=1620943 RepID=A0ABV6M279_9ACTN